MKLTKGKITKLYSKKRQSRKRYKNTKADSKNKTFRRRRSLDLNKRTLKRVPYGGAKLGDEITSGEESPLGTSEIPSKNRILPKGDETLPGDKLPVEINKSTSITEDETLPVEINKSKSIAQDETLPVEINKSKSIAQDETLPGDKLPQDETLPGDQLPVEINKSNSITEDETLPGDQLPVEINKSTSITQDETLPGDQLPGDQLPVEINKSTSINQDETLPEDQLPVEINKSNSINETLPEDQSPVEINKPSSFSNNFSLSKTFSDSQSNDFDSDNSTIAQAFKTLADYVSNNIAAKIKSGLIPPLVSASQTQAGTENLSTALLDNSSQEEDQL